MGEFADLLRAKKEETPPGEFAGLVQARIKEKPEALATGVIQKTPVIEGQLADQRQDIGGEPSVVRPPGFEGVAAGIEKATDFLTGKLRQTKETFESPELLTGIITGEVDVGGVGDTIKSVAGMLFSLDPKAQKDIVKSAVPDVKFKTDDKGNEIATFPNGKKAVVNKPGFTIQDASSLAANVIMFMPAAKVASLGTALIAKVGLGALGAGLTETGIQVGEQALGSEQGFKPLDIAAATALGGVGETVLPAARAIGRRATTPKAARQLERQIPPEDLPRALESISGAEEITEQTGIQFGKGEKLLTPAALAEQEVLAESAGGAFIATKQIEKQNQQIEKGLTNFVDEIAKPETTENALVNFKNDAKRAINKEIDLRRAKASPIYKQAFEEGAQVDIQPVLDNIDEILPGLTTTDIAKDIQKVRKLFVDLPEENLLELHNIKRQLGQNISRLGAKALPESKRELTKIQIKLLEQMDEASPTYKEARAIFANDSPKVTQIKESVLGRISKFKEPDLKRIRKLLFDPEEATVNPTVIKRIKKQLDDINPNAFQEIMRIEFEGRLGKANLPGEPFGLPSRLLNNVFKNDAGIKAVMTKDQSKNYNYLKNALVRSAKARPLGSRTQPLQAARERLTGGVAEEAIKLAGETRRGVAQAFVNFFRGATTAKVRSAKERALSELYFNPLWSPQLTKIRRLNPNSPAAFKAMTQLLNDIGAENDNTR